MNGLTYNIADIANFIKLSWAGRKVQLVPYAYGLTFTGLAQAATAVQQLNIQSNADFVLTHLTHRASIAAAAQTVSNKTAPFVRALFTDNGSSANFTQNAVDLESYSTNGDGIPKALPYPRIISGRSSVTCQLTNYSGGAGETYLIDLTFHGIQVYDLGAA